MEKLYVRFTYYLLGLILVFGSLSFKPDDPKDIIKDTDPIQIIESEFFTKKSITDGPYIFKNNDEITVKWIRNYRVVKKNIRKNNFKIIEKNFGFVFDPNWIDDVYSEKIDYIQKYTNVENLIAVSDVHGQYDLLVKLLQNHNVIDNDFNWNFGSGHLVVLGDIFDRGEQVTKILWLIFRLEQQAKDQGGKIHVLVGNHELMVLNRDLRYVNKKYIESAQLMSTSYDKLFSENSLLGKWIMNKPVLVSINDMLFVHAGVSPELISIGYTQTQINEIFNKGIIGKDNKEILTDPILSLIRGKYGPVWYRDYFKYPSLPETEVDKLLKYFDTKHIIVGHTSMPNIVSIYNSKIIGIDSSIKLGDTGEVLVLKNNEFYRGTTNGSLIKL